MRWRQRKYRIVKRFALFPKLFDLCPRCAKIHEEVLSNFYERCTEARDKDDFGL